MRGKSVVVMAVTLVVAVTAGCSRGESSQAEPTERPSPPSAESSAPPSVSPEADTSTPESTIRAWFAASDHLHNTGEAARFEELSTRVCDHCAAYSRAVQKTYAAGGEAHMADSEVTAIAITEVDGATYYEARVLVPPSTKRAKAGAPQERYPGGESRLLLQMLLTPDGWRVDGVFGAPS